MYRKCPRIGRCPSCRHKVSTIGVRNSFPSEKSPRASAKDAGPHPQYGCLDLCPTGLPENGAERWTCLISLRGGGGDKILGSTFLQC
jgi:hypothetical protein